MICREVGKASPSIADTGDAIYAKNWSAERRNKRFPTEEKRAQRKLNNRATSIESVFTVTPLWACTAITNGTPASTVEALLLGHISKVSRE